MSKLNGVDISGWDKGIDVRALSADFVVVKATEGMQGTVYNPDYRDMAEDALASGKLLGFYHYANGGDPVKEAESFYAAIKGYEGAALPCLDWERQGNKSFGTRDDVTWCRRFLDRISELMGATAVLYTSKGVCNTYDWSSVAADYPLWGAEYAYENKVYDGYQDEPWQSALGWGAWGKTPLMHQYGYVSPRPHNGGKTKLDGEVFYGTRAAWTVLCKPKTASASPATSETSLSYAEMAAQICEHFILHDAHGYSQIHRDGDGTVETITLSDGTAVSFNGGDRDCSRLVQTCYVVAGVLPRGMHMWTGNELQILQLSGFRAVALGQVKRGDVLWRQGHTELYLGSGMQGGARRSETHGIDGKTGDQDGYEICRSTYYPQEWSSAWRCTKERPKPSPQVPGTAKSDLGLKYRVQAQNHGWLEVVHDGQVAGTTGRALRAEALKITPPEGVVLNVMVHIEDIGDATYKGIKYGKASPVMGTVGEGKRLEAIKIDVTTLPGYLVGKVLRYKVHLEGTGWTKTCKQGQWCGTRGKGKRIEAVRIWFE